MALQEHKALRERPVQPGRLELRAVPDLLEAREQQVLMARQAWQE